MCSSETLWSYMFSSAWWSSQGCSVNLVCGLSERSSCCNFTCCGEDASCCESDWWFIKQVCMGLSGPLPFACSCRLLSCHNQGLLVGQPPPERTAAVGRETVPGGSWERAAHERRSKSAGEASPCAWMGAAEPSPTPSSRPLQRAGVGPWVCMSAWYLRRSAQGSGHVLPADPSWQAGMQYSWLL